MECLPPTFRRTSAQLPCPRASAASKAVPPCLAIILNGNFGLYSNRQSCHNILHDWHLFATNLTISSFTLLFYMVGTNVLICFCTLQTASVITSWRIRGKVHKHNHLAASNTSSNMLCWQIGSLMTLSGYKHYLHLKLLYYSYTSSKLMYVTTLNGMTLMALTSCTCLYNLSTLQHRVS